jgi:hypothetical protein
MGMTSFEKKKAPGANHNHLPLNLQADHAMSTLQNCK